VKPLSEAEYEQLVERRPKRFDASAAALERFPPPTHPLLENEVIVGALPSSLHKTVKDVAPDEKHLRVFPATLRGFTRMSDVVESAEQEEESETATPKPKNGAGGKTGVV
jgi:hypothetical protein